MPGATWLKFHNSIRAINTPTFFPFISLSLIFLSLSLSLFFFLFSLFFLTLSSFFLSLYVSLSSSSLFLCCLSHLSYSFSQRPTIIILKSGIQNLLISLPKHGSTLVCYLLCTGRTWVQRERIIDSE